MALPASALWVRVETWVTREMQKLTPKNGTFNFGSFLNRKFSGFSAVVMQKWRRERNRWWVRERESFGGGDWWER